MNLLRCLYFNLLLIQTKVLCMEHKSFNTTQKYELMIQIIMIYFLMLSLMILSCFLSEKKCKYAYRNSF